MTTSTEPGTFLAGSSPLHGKLTITGYELPDDLTYDEWAAEGHTLIAMARASMWWVGDWLRYGEFRYGEKYAQAVEATGLAVQTLKNAQWVADRIPPPERNPDLSFSHHKAVAALDKSPRRDLLKRAAAEHMSEGELLGRVRAIKAEEAGKEPPPPPAKSLHEVATDSVRLLWQAQDTKDWKLVAAARVSLEEAIRGR